MLKNVLNIILKKWSFTSFLVHKSTWLHPRSKSLIALVSGLLSPIGYAGPIELAKIDQWKSHSFVGESRFEFDDTRECLLMIADQTASAKIFEHIYPLQSKIQWQWVADQALDLDTQKTKATDDFTARVYIIVKHPWLFWQSRVLSYVMSNDVPTNEYWPNPYTDQFMMWSVSQVKVDEWQSVTRNIAEDWQQAFGDQPEEFHGIGLMVDGDNSKQKTASCLKGLSVSEIGG